jgi:arylsulfatase A-like enzyme
VEPHVSDRPYNVIVLTSDEMRGDTPGYMGNPDCRTPCLDRFAAKGVAFRNHYTVHGKCVPARVAMMTGRYCHTDGFRTIHQHLPPDQPNLLGKLKELGYESAVFGINHVWETLFASNEKSEGYADYHSFVGHYHEMAFREFPVPEPGPDSVEPMALPPGFDYAGRIEEKITGFSDDACTEQAIDYLTRTRERSRPFYMQLNLSAPHPKYRVEEPWFSMYDRERIQAWPHELPDAAPLPYRSMREIRTGVEDQDRAFREVQCTYYGMVNKVDSLQGKVLDAIEAEGLFKDSIVVYTVDHGDFAGQYGLVEKWDTCMADCIMHVPLIVWAPGLPHGVWVESLSEHTDLAATVLDLLGVEPDWGIHGESLLPIIRGERRKEAVFADGGHEEEMWARFNWPDRDREGRPRSIDGKQRTYRDCPEAMSRAKMVRTERWKLVMRLVGGNELYDMQADPWELHNLWGRHEGDPELRKVVLGLQQRLIEWCLRTDTDRPFQEDVGA